MHSANGSTWYRKHGYGSIVVTYSVVAAVSVQFMGSRLALSRSLCRSSSQCFLNCLEVFRIAVINAVRGLRNTQSGWPSNDCLNELLHGDTEFIYCNNTEASDGWQVA